MSLDSIAQPHAMSMAGMRPNAHFDLQKDLLPMPSTLPSLSSNSNMGQAKRKRDDKPSPEKPTKSIKKAQSTPNLAEEDDDADSADGEKKRNKLGYHRTSVACGHCRRRKIRCMMPDDDPTGRCSNCIRLKKECNFYPVDQATKGPHPSARAVSMPKGALRSQSPTPMYLPSTYGEYPTFGGHSSFSVPPPDTTGLGLFNATTASGFEGGYATAYDTPVTTWDSSPYAAMPPIGAAPHFENHHMGRNFESPLSASPAPQSFTRPSSTFRPSPFPDSAYGSAGSSKADANEIGWAPAGRTFSPQPPMDGRRSASIPAPPSLIMGGDNSSTPTLSEPTTIAPMSTTLAGSSYWQNPWTPIPGTEGMTEPSKAFTAGEPYETGSWFPDPINSY